MGCRVANGATRDKSHPKKSMEGFREDIWRGEKPH